MNDTAHSADSNNGSRWQFVQAEDSTWHWHRGANGDGPTVSEPFDNFGRCLSDAIKHGFRPDLHPYSTRAGGAVSGPPIDWSHDKRPGPTR